LQAKVVNFVQLLSSPDKLPAAWQALDQDAQTLILVLSVTLPLFLFFIVICCWRTGARGDAILLLGVSDSGKTVAFFKLWKGNAVPIATHTSMKPNEERFVIHKDLNSVPSSKPVRIVDFPGDPRVRTILSNLYLRDARAIVFFVDAIQFQRESRVVAEYLLDLMSDKTIRKAHKRLPMLVAVNKSDEPGAASVEAVRLKLEREIEQLRKTRAASEVHADESDRRLSVGLDDKKFEFSDAPFEVSFTATVAAKGDLKEVVSFVQKVVR